MRRLVEAVVTTVGVVVDATVSTATVVVVVDATVSTAKVSVRVISHTGFGGCNGVVGVLGAWW